MTINVSNRNKVCEEKGFESVGGKHHPRCCAYLDYRLPPTKTELEFPFAAAGKKDFPFKIVMMNRRWAARGIGVKSD